MSKPVDAVKSQSIPALALMLAYARVMQSQPEPRKRRTKPTGQQIPLPEIEEEKPCEKNPSQS